MKDLIIIPARYGSKRIPRKNLSILGGQPLVMYTLKFAHTLQEKYNLDVVVTSDDHDVMKLAANFNFNIIDREEALSNDSATTTAVCLDAVSQMVRLHKVNYELIHLLQVTSPFRSTTSFDDLKNLFKSDEAVDSVFSVSQEDSAHPAYMYRLNRYGQIKQFIEQDLLGKRMQDLPPAYKRNGAFYSIKRKLFESTHSFIPDLSKARWLDLSSENIVNIDTSHDLKYARFLVDSGEINI